MNKFLLEGEELDYEEIERRKVGVRDLKVYGGEALRVIDGCEDNTGTWSEKLVTWFADRDSTVNHCVFYSDAKAIEARRSGGVGFCTSLDYVSSYHSDCLPLACIKTVARQALERLAKS